VEFQQLIGFFANTIVVRVRLAGNPPFATLLERVRESALGAYDHQHVPFEQIVEAVRPQRDPGVNPLFQVNFRVRVGEPPQLELSGATTRRLPVDVGSARFDLALELQLGDDGLVAELIYNTDLFDRTTVEGLSADFEALLRQVLADPETRLLGFDVPSQLAAQGNGPAGRVGGIRRFRETAGPPASDS
jgi:non-ribosomal peptide synthetase component F